jgi:hypothetical protein
MVMDKDYRWMLRLPRADFDTYVAASVRANKSLPDWVRSSLTMMAEIEAEEAAAMGKGV